MTKEAWIDTIIVFITLIAAVVLLMYCYGCRSQTTFKYYESGKLQEACYKDGFSFFSEGTGKSIEISPVVSGVNF